jgi:starch synthase
MSRPEDVARHREILARAHLMVLPSSGEAFGIATVEAALEGIPAVVSDVGGLPEAVVHGETGVVVPVAAPADAYVRAILELVDDPERYAAMSRAARERALSEHTWDRWGDRVARLVRDLVAETRAGYRRSG